MISSKRVLVTGGQFSQYNYHGQASLDNKAAIDILTDAVAPSAFHDSGARFDPPKCHLRTRVKVLEKIMGWIVGRYEDTAAKPLLWLNGAAGAGKSAIAQSIIEQGIERGLLLASFFFSRSDPSRNHAGPLIATLAYQLYCAFPETEVQTSILSAIKKDPLIFKKTLQRQFTSLVIQPLRTYLSRDQSTQHRIPFVIVIDGLDECVDRASQKTILTCLADSMLESNPFIRIFVASRPEHDIKLTFSSKNLKDVHNHLSLDFDHGYEADRDINLYLCERFAQIKDDFDNRTSGKKLDLSWPGEEVIDRLVRNSSGQFIYAATVILYVESTRHRPDHRLDIVLDLRPNNGDNPFAQLDALYAMILESALNIEKVLHVLSLHMMDSRQTLVCCPIIEKLLSYDEGELETLFCDLGALVQTRWVQQSHDSQQYLHILHASLLDYLMDEERSKQFHIDRGKEDIKHLIHILQYLASYCSSSFNENLEMPLLYIFSLNILASRWGTTSHELRQAAFSFPLKQFLEPHSETGLYSGLLQFFVNPFLGLLEIIAQKDPQCSYIKDHQHRILVSVLNHELEQYYNDDALAWLLVTFYHLGSHRFVPIIKHHSHDEYSIPRGLACPPSIYHDTFSLCRTWNTTERTGHTSDILHCRYTFFHDFVRRWLRDPSQSALGPRTYEKAALTCFKQLGAISLPLASSAQDMAMGDAGDDTCLSLELAFYDVNGGQWTFSIKKDWSSISNDGELYFLLLGYITFLLPRCGRSDALTLACEEYKASFAGSQRKGWAFPVRRRLLRVEINNYLARGEVFTVGPLFLML